MDKYGGMNSSPPVLQRRKVQSALWRIPNVTFWS
ncbi:hypothetical protein OROGR_027826 [Orobanche gracilis]